jgi:hypothetical protein
LVVVSSAGVNEVPTVHPGSVLGATWQLPSEELTVLVIWLAGEVRGLSTLTVKRTVALPGPPAVVAAGTGTFWVQAVPAGEGGGPLTQLSQPSPSPA